MTILDEISDKGVFSINLLQDNTLALIVENCELENAISLSKEEMYQLADEIIAIADEMKS